MADPKSFVTVAWAAPTTSQSGAGCVTKDGKAVPACDQQSRAGIVARQAASLRSRPLRRPYRLRRQRLPHRFSYWQLHCPSPTDAFDKNVRSSSAHVVPAASPDARRAGACECAIRVVHKPPQPPAHVRRRLRSMPAGASHQPRRRGHRSTPDRPSYT